MLIAQSKFDERYYRWALLQWEREIAEDFPLLRSIYDNNAQLAIRLMTSIGKDQQGLLAETLAKRFRKPMLAQWGESFTAENEQFEKLFMRECSRSICSAPSYQHSKNTQAHKASPKDLKRRLLKALTPVLGQPCERSGGAVCKYRTMIGPWQVVTYFDVGARFHQLSYAHDIMTAGQIYLARSISLLSWLGISSQVMLQKIDQGNAEAIAHALARIIERFVDVVPELLEALSPE